MGRKSPVVDPNKGMSTLERSISKSKNLKSDSTRFKSDSVKTSDVLR